MRKKYFSNQKNHLGGKKNKMGTIDRKKNVSNFQTSEVPRQD